MASGQIEPGGMAEKYKPGVNELRLERGTPGVDAGHPNFEDAQRILQSIREAAKHVDLMIAYQHNHAYDANFQTMFREELPERLVPPKWIKAWAHEEVDAGAYIVVLHGAPILQGVEIYRGKPIFYDLGNFIFNLPLRVDWFEPIAFESIVAHAEFQGKTLKSVTFGPIVLNPTGRGDGALALRTRGLPSPAGERSGYILRRLAEVSRLVGTTVEVNGHKAKVKLNSATTGL